MCGICGRLSCIRSFHSLSEQEEFDTKTGRYAPEEAPEEMMLDESGNRSIFDDVDEYQNDIQAANGGMTQTAIE